jgi:hypothetical protein
MYRLGPTAAPRSYRALAVRSRLARRPIRTRAAVPGRRAEPPRPSRPGGPHGPLTEILSKVLVRSLTAEFDPDKYQDDYRIQVLDLIGRKAAGEEFELPAVEAERPKIVDMMAALEASVEAAKAARGRHPTARQALDAAAKKPAKRAAKPRARKTA